MGASLYDAQLKKVWALCRDAVQASGFLRAGVFRPRAAMMQRNSAHTDRVELYSVWASWVKSGWWWQQILLTGWWTSAKTKIKVQGQGQDSGRGLETLQHLCSVLKWSPGLWSGGSPGGTELGQSSSVMLSQPWEGISLTPSPIWNVPWINNYNWLVQTKRVLTQVEENWAIPFWFCYPK